MRIFSYRNKRLLKRTLLIALAVLLGILALIVCRFIYLGRFVTYDNAGAHLDYEQHLTATRAPEPAVSDEDFSFDTVLDAASEEDGDTAQTAKLTGYYITTTMLASGVDQVRAALSQADDYNAVMVDVKSIFGSFYYSTAISGAAKATVLDIKQVDQLIAELAQQKGVTLIARVPAFSDPEYALKHQSQALPLYNGALWTDEHDCYWLNPYSNDVQGYLTSIALELAGLGFDEVLFDNFYFPDSDRISWTGSVTKQEAILDAADNLSANLLNQSIRLDLGTNDPEVAAYGARAFITTNNASQIDDDIAALSDVLPDTASQLVYLATPASMPAAHCARCSTKPNKCTERAAAAARSVFDLLRSKRKIHNRVSFFLCDRYTIDETLCSCFQLSAYSLLSKFGISFRFERLNSFTAASKGSSNGNGV